MPSRTRPPSLRFLNLLLQSHSEGKDLSRRNNSAQIRLFRCNATSLQPPLVPKIFLGFSTTNKRWSSSKSSSSSSSSTFFPSSSPSSSTTSEIAHSSTKNANLPIDGLKTETTLQTSAKIEDNPSTRIPVIRKVRRVPVRKIRRMQPKSPPLTKESASLQNDAIFEKDVLSAVTLDCEKILSQLLRMPATSKYGQSMLLLGGCLLDSTRKLLQLPHLVEAMLESQSYYHPPEETSASCFSKRLVASPSLSKTKLTCDRYKYSFSIIHQTFVVFLSTAIQNTRTDAKQSIVAVEQVVIPKEGINNDNQESLVHLFKEDRDLFLELVIQLTRQAHRLGLPLHHPLHENLAVTVATLNHSLLTSKVIRLHNEDGNKEGDPKQAMDRLQRKAVCDLLLEIASWHAASSASLTLIDHDKDDIRRFNQGIEQKLKFLAPMMVNFIERKQYGIARDIFEELVADPQDDNDPASNLIVAADLNDLLTLFAVLKTTVQEHLPTISEEDLAHIRAMMFSLQSCALDLIVKHKKLITSHPHFQKFLSRFFLLDSDDFDDVDGDGMQVDDILDIDLDDNNVDKEFNAVWDPIVADLMMKDASADLSTEQMISTLSDFYVRVSAAMHAKFMDTVRIRGPMNDATSIPSSYVKRKRGTGVADRASTLIEDLRRLENEEEKEEMDSDEEVGAFDHIREYAAIRRRHMYLRGQGKHVDAHFFPDILSQMIQLNHGSNMRFTNSYEELIWKRDFLDDDDDLSTTTLDDLDESDTGSDDEDDDGTDF